MAQIERLSHVSTLYPTLPVVELAETLARLAPGQPLSSASSRRRAPRPTRPRSCWRSSRPGATEIVALRHGYSGRSMLAQSLTAHSTWRAAADAGRRRSSTRVSPYCYRCPLKLTYPSCGVACAKDIEELIRTTTTGRIAGFLAEPIQGVGGFITPPPEYFEIAVDIIRKYGGVFICDEVQTGFGRTGGKMWGIEHYGVEPDIMTMAKGIANGLPLGATIATPEIAASLKALTISTFGGNPVSCAAANATIVDHRGGGPAGKRRADGRAPARRPRGAPEALPAVDRRGPRHGPHAGARARRGRDRGQPHAGEGADAHVFEETKKRGLLIGKGGLDGNCFRIAPALNVTRGDVEEALTLLGESFDAAGAR